MTKWLPLALVLLLPSPALADDRPDPDYRITKVRVRPAAGKAADLKGGQFAGSLTSPTNDFETLAEVKDAPVGDGWVELAVPKGRVRAYRYVKFVGKNGTRAEVAEVEFFAGGKKLAGTPFGTSGDGADPKLAFDGDPATAFRGAGTHQQYVGLDLGEKSQAARPEPSVSQGAYQDAQVVALASATPGAKVAYSLDAWGRPGLDDKGKPTGGAKVYDSPIRVTKSAILQAVAVKPGLADSPPLVAAYRIGDAVPAAGEVASFHIGNSLTDTVNPWLEPLAASAGKPYRFYRFTIPGAPTDWLWDHPGSGFGESNYAQAFLARAPLTDLVTQPFAGHGRGIDNEADYSGRFFDLARKHSPQVRPWLYVQWPEEKWDKDRWANGKATDGGKEVVFGQPAKTWQDAVANHARYTERVAERMNAARADAIKAGTCRPVRVIPGGLALARLKTEMEAGKVPGLTDFGATVFAGPGDFHLTKAGAYLVSLVHNACLWGESPEGKVTAAGSGLTAEQAKLFQRLAWETARDYPPAGLAKKP